MGIPHVLAVPFPAQGHLIPLMEFVQRFVKRGSKVTFVNTDFIHERVMNALSEKDGNVGDNIHLVSISDGLDPCDDRTDLGKLSETIFRVMPGKLEELIEKINATDDNKITCLIAYQSMGWALKIAEKMGIRGAAFWPASAALLGSVFCIPKLIEDKIINKNGRNHDTVVVLVSLWQIMEKLFTATECNDRDMLSFAIFLVEEDAEFWWKIVELKWAKDRTPQIWANVLIEFEQQYVPPSARDKRELEFTQLEQGDMTVAQYIARFNRLSWHCSYMVDTEERKAKRFFRGLKPTFQNALDLHFHEGKGS